MRKVGRALLFLATLVGALYLGAMAIAQAIDIAVSMVAPGLCSRVQGDMPGLSLRCGEGLLGTVAGLVVSIGELLHFLPVLFVFMLPWEEAPALALLFGLPMVLLAFCIVRAVFVGLRWLDGWRHRRKPKARS